jgi:hypothetical protein
MFFSSFKKMKFREFQLFLLGVDGKTFARVPKKNFRMGREEKFVEVVSGLETNIT